MSNRALICNDNISFVLPDCLREMTSQDAEEIGAQLTPNDYGAIGKDLHIMLNISWKKIPLIARAVSLQKALAATEDNYKRQISSFEHIMNYEREISGQTALGFRIRYATKGIDMVTDYLLVKRDKFYYAFIFLAREETHSEVFGIFEQVLDTVEIN